MYIYINYGVEIHRVRMHKLCLQVNNNKPGNDVNCWRHAQEI